MGAAPTRFLVEGKVQGVGFRWFVVDAARRLELAGSVRNLPDGTVEILAIGDDAVLDELHSIVRKGPAGARVKSVQRSRLQGDQILPSPFQVAR